MTKDRTNQLHAQGGINKDVSLDIEEREAKEEEPLTGSSRMIKIIRSKSKEKGCMESVFAHVNEIIALIETIKETVVILRKYHYNVQHSSRVDKSAKDENENLNEIIKSTSVTVVTKIKDLELKKYGDANNAVNRVINTQQILLKKLHRDAIDEYEGALIAHRKNCENIIKKELLIVIEKLIRRVEYVAADVHVSEQDLMAILDTEDTAVFVDNYMKETAEARELLQDVRDRHKQVLAIEQDIATIRDMFMQLSLHVVQQGELIDRIEYHIGNGLMYTTKGHKRLTRILKVAKRIRKKKFCIIICLGSVVAILLLFVVLNGLI